MLGEDSAPGEDVGKIRLRLYLLRGAARSEQALINFAVVAEPFEGDYELEIVDVSEEPMRALRDGVLIAPTLMRLTPPASWIIGDLSDADALRAAVFVVAAKSNAG